MGDLGKIIVAKSFKKLPKVQKIAKSGHTARFKPKNEANKETNAAILSPNVVK